MSGIMHHTEGNQPLNQLEPPAGATCYETNQLSGTKRQYANDDNEEDTMHQSGHILQDTQALQPRENALKHFNENADHETTQADAPNTAKKRKVESAKGTTDKNKTRTTSNGLEVDIGGSWYPAIYHNEYVQTFEDRLFTPKYTHGRDSGSVGESNGKFDKTAYLEAQKDWGKSRHHRPAILFEFKKPENAYHPTDPPALACVKNGVSRIIVDCVKNKPLRAFPHIPAAISTKVEGWLQEAWFRQDAGVQAEDLIQRMPYTAKHGVYDDRKIINRLVRRRELFRDEGRCLSWKKATYEKICDRDLIDKMTKTPNPAEPNSTRHLIDLTSEQIKAFKDATYATKKYLRRGKAHQLGGERREQKDREVGERLAARAAEAVPSPVESQTANGHPGLGQTQRGENSTQATSTHAVCNVTPMQPQRRPALQAVGNQSHLMAPPTIQRTASRRLTNRHCQEQSHDDLSRGYRDYAHQGHPIQNAAPSAMGHSFSEYQYHAHQGHLVQSAAPPAMAYPFSGEFQDRTHQRHPVGGSIPRATGYPFPSFTNSYPPPAPAPFGPKGQRYVAQRLTKQSRNLEAHRRREANIDELQENQGTHERRGIRDNFNRLSGNFDRAPTSSAGMNGQVRSQLHPVSRNLGHGFDANTCGSNVSPLDIYHGDDRKRYEFMPNELNCNETEPEIYDIYSRQQPLSAQQHRQRQNQQEQCRTSCVDSCYADPDEDFWRDLDLSGLDNGYMEHDIGLDLDLAGAGPGRHRVKTAGEHSRQGESFDPQRDPSTAMGHTSTRKRGAEAEFDGALDSSSRKSRRL